MSRPHKHYVFNPDCPRVVVTAATPLEAVFANDCLPGRDTKSQDPAYLVVPAKNIGKNVAGNCTTPYSRPRSQSVPNPPRIVHSDPLYLTQKYAAKAPWKLEGQGPARLDLSFWKSRKGRRNSTGTPTTESASKNDPGITPPPQALSMVSSSRCSKQSAKASW